MLAKHLRHRSCGLLIVLGLLLGAPAFSSEAPSKERAPSVDCEMTFSLKSWSAFYKKGKGEGHVECDNGEEADVVIRVHAGGLTFGKSEIINGQGVFSNVYEIEEIFGSYAAAEAHAGAVRSSDAIAMTNGPVSLALAGTGRGWDVGVAFGKFKIKRK